MNTPGYDAVIPAHVRYHPELAPFAGEKLIYGEIRSLSNKFGYCFANNQHFADLYRVETRTIQYLLARLVKLNLIYIEVDAKAGNKRKIYLCPDYQLAPDAPPSRNLIREVTKSHSPPHEISFTQKKIFNNINNNTISEQTSCSPEVFELDNNFKKKKKRPIVTPPISEILDLYAKMLPWARQPHRELTASRKRALDKLRKFSIGDYHFSELETWEFYFERINASKFLRGECAPRAESSVPFTLDFDKVLNIDKYVIPIYEGKYDDR